MVIKSINIINFKSIKNITIPVQNYGKDEYASNTTFFVGINESGKSAILEAISLINAGFDNIKYEDYCHSEARENDDYIDIYTEIELSNQDFWRKPIIEKIKLPEEFVSKIEIIGLKKNTYIGKDGLNNVYNVTINDDLSFFHYIINKEQVLPQGSTKAQTVETIVSLSEFNNIKDTITQENAKTFLKENQELLTKKELEKKLQMD